MSDTFQIFLCYRHEDGRELAEWLDKNLNGRTCTVEDQDEPAVIDVYFDEKTPGGVNWKEIHQPALKLSKCMLFIATPGAFAELPEEDWVHKELKWWVKHRQVSPIVINPTREGQRWLPQILKKRWPDSQHINVDLAAWQILEPNARNEIEEQAIQRIVDGITYSKSKTTQQELQKQKRRTQAIFALFAITASLLLATLWQWQKASENKKLAVENEIIAKQNEKKAVENLKQMVTGNGCRMLEQDRVWEALLWFAESLQIQGGAPDKSSSVRAGTYLRNTPKIEQVLYHDLPVNDAGFSPDGRFIVTATGKAYSHEDQKSEARVWDIETGEIVFSLPHNATVYSASFSPDGSKILTSDDHGIARIWDAKSGAPIFATQGQAARMRRAHFNRDGSRIVTAAEKVSVWDVHSREELHFLWGDNQAFFDAEFSLDGDKVIVIYAPNPHLDSGIPGYVVVWDLKTNQTTGPDPPHTEDWVYSAKLSPDAKRAVSGGDDNRALLWDVETGLGIGKPMLHDAPVNYVAFSPDGEYILSACEDGTAWLWHGRNGEPVMRWDADTRKKEQITFRHGAYIKHAQFSPDGRAVLTGSTDGTVRLWRTGTGAPLTPPMRHSSTNYPIGGFSFLTWTRGLGAESALGFSPDGSRILCAGWDNKLVLWDISQGARLKSLLPDLNKTCIAAGAAHALNRYAGAVIERDGQTIRVWDLMSSQPISEPLQHQNQIQEAMFSADGSMLLTKCKDETIRIWDFTNNREVCAPKRPDAPIQHIAFSPNNDAIIMLCGLKDTAPERKVILYNFESEKQVLLKLKDGERIEKAQLAPEGRILVTSSGDEFIISGYKYVPGQIKFWNPETGEPLPSSPDIKGTQEGFSQDGRLLVVSNAGILNVWDLDAGRQVSAIEDLDGELSHLAFSPDNKNILTVSVLNQSLGKGFMFRPQVTVVIARVWDAETGDPVTRPLPHHPVVKEGGFNVTTPVPYVKPRIRPFGFFSFDSEWIATIGPDHTLRVWETRTGLPVSPYFNHSAGIHKAWFSSDHQKLMAISADGGVWEWPLPHLDQSPEKLMDIAQLLSSQYIDPSGLMKFLRPDEADGLWKQLGQKTSILPMDQVQKKLMWHAREALLAEADSDWKAAIFHYDHMIQLNPEDWKYHAHRAHLYTVSKSAFKAMIDTSRAIYHQIPNSDDEKNKIVSKIIIQRLKAEFDRLTEIHLKTNDSHISENENDLIADIADLLKSLLYDDNDKEVANIKKELTIKTEKLVLYE